MSDYDRMEVELPPGTIALLVYAFALLLYTAWVAFAPTVASPWVIVPLALILVWRTLRPDHFVIEVRQY